PPLPPREPIVPRSPTPSYSLLPATADCCSSSYSSGDSRSRNAGLSTASKSAPGSLPMGKRKLLLVYIHDFVGNESNFQSFPVYLHHLLSVALRSLGGGVHSKGYLQPKAKNNISIATARFSKWLA
ncbi:unnamed protein product, partial [Tuber aestivum]